MKIEFFKGEATGNDFIVISSPVNIDWLSIPLIQNLCDRHFGIGADGILAILPSNTADLKMRIFNSDGSEAEMCGNGIRLASIYAKEVLGWPSSTITFETLAGPKNCRIEQTEGIYQVTVAMGKPKASPMSVQLKDKTFDGWFVDTGNPHFVILSDNARADAVEFGYDLTVHPAFKEGANVHFLEKLGNNEWFMVPYERGAGMTLSCGTGVTAASYVLITNSLVDKNEVRLKLPGGRLKTFMDQGNIMLIGPARLTFNGTFTI